MEIDIADQMSPFTIDDLPEEIMEYILSKVSPYRDLKSSMLVCRRWYRLASGVIRQLRQVFLNSVYENKVEWQRIEPEIGIRLTERYSHCACYYDKSLYVFGGCTSTNTTFNDLWRFDLARREWIRPLAMGTYPSPKACASMVVYKDSLVLFGGWSHPTPYPLHQAAGFFYELHIYKPEANRWYLVTSISREHPPPTAGHSASIVGDKMVLFGGSSVPGTGTNDLWTFDFIELTWKRIATGDKKPSPRFGQTQVTVDDHHILVIGGCGGPNQIFNDMWLLSMDKEPWEWTEVKVSNTDFAAPQLWCHPATKVGNMIAVLSKPTKSLPKQPTQTCHTQLENVQQNRVWVPPIERDLPQGADGDDSEPSTSQGRGFSRFNDSRGHSSSSTESDDEGHPHYKRPLNSHASHRLSSQGHLRLEQSESDSSKKLGAMLNFVEHQKQLQLSAMESTSSVHPGAPSVRPNAMSNRQKQLEALRRMEEKLRESMANQAKQRQLEQSKSSEASNINLSRQREPRSQMQLHVLDISQVVSHGEVTWRPINENFSFEAPDETTFYSLVEGRGELIMFGGIQRDIQSMQRGVDLKSHLVSNILYILAPFKSSI